MKIKDIITEGLYDFLTQIGQQGKQAAWAKRGEQKFYADQRAPQQAARQFKPNPTRTTPPSQQVAQNQQSQGQRVLDPEVQVIKAVDPTILQFNNKRYTRQPNGQWTKLGQTKPIDVPMQQFLNSELAKL